MKKATNQTDKKEVSITLAPYINILLGKCWFVLAAQAQHQKTKETTFRITTVTAMSVCSVVNNFLYIFLV